MKQTILFVDDDAPGRQVALYNLREAGHEVEEAASGEDALQRFNPQAHHLVITDMRMPGLSGMELLKRIKAITADIPVLVITAYGTIDTAVEAMKVGAEDFILKPFSKAQLLLAVDRALARQALRRENRDLRLKVSGVERPLVYHSTAMTELLAVVDRVAPTDATVLITGESGTGKELLARRLHVRSARAEKPFVAVNCGAIPAELLEAELFGHTKGAFTGAVRERRGRFRQADGGTLLLDEVGEVAPSLQVKLLRALQEHVVDVVGSDEPVPVDVRILAATNQDLEAMLHDGTFREDLFYRLNVVSMRVPPLRERLEDIIPLAEYFVAQFGAGRELQLPEALREVLSKHDWPGNVRELENVCNRLVVLCAERDLAVSDLPPAFSKYFAAAPCADRPPDAEVCCLTLPESGLSLFDLEKGVIERVLTRAEWNVSKAAQYLNVPRHVVAYRMEKYGIRKR
jgi:DNA-binding NtrC family response regulator